MGWNLVPVLQRRQHSWQRPLFPRPNSLRLWLLLIRGLLLGLGPTHVGPGGWCGAPGSQLRHQWPGLGMGLGLVLRLGLGLRLRPRLPGTGHHWVHRQVLRPWCWLNLILANRRLIVWWRRALISRTVNPVSSSSSAVNRESVMPTNFDLRTVYLSHKLPMPSACVEASQWTEFKVSVFLSVNRRMPETRDISFLSFSFSFINFLISFFWFLSVFLKESISVIRISTWFWRAFRSLISAWSSILVAKGFASRRKIIWSSDSEAVIFSLTELFKGSPTSVAASKSVRLWSVINIRSWLSPGLLWGSNPAPWLGEGMGVIWLGVGEEVAVETFFLHALKSLALFLSRSRSFFSTRLDFFLLCPRLATLGVLAARALGLDWPGGGVDNDWLWERRVGGDRNPANVVWTILGVFVTGIKSLFTAPVRHYGLQEPTYLVNCPLRSLVETFKSSG